MTEQDLIIQELRRENAMLKEQLEQLRVSHIPADPRWRVRYRMGSNLFCDGLCTACIHNQHQITTTGGTNL